MREIRSLYSLSVSYEFFPGSYGSRGETVHCFHLAQNMVQWRALVNTVMNLRVTKGGEFLDHLTTISFSVTFLYGVWMCVCMYVDLGVKIAVFWVVAPCSLAEVYQRFRGDCCLHHQVCKLLPDYTAQQSRRQPSSYSPLWEPEISQASRYVCAYVCMLCKSIMYTHY
jgi:hypothetical protein